MPGLYTGAQGLWGGQQGLRLGTALSTPPGLLADVSAGGPQLWTPAELGAALALWLDASDAATVTESGGFVSQWDDKSGNSRDFTQGVAGTQPAYALASINGLNTISFDGTNDSIARVAESWAYNYPINVFTIFKATAFNASYNGLFGFYTSAGPTTAGFGAFIKSNGTSAIYATDTSNGQPNYDGTGALTYAINTGYIFGATIGDNSITSFGDGTADGSASGTWTLRNNVGSGDVNVGSDPRFARYTEWEIGESIITTGGAISIANREKMEGYLAWKWGLQGSLPPSHPYKNAPPYVTPSPGPSLAFDDPFNSQYLVLRSIGGL
jgi:hypothetical protein